MKGITSYKRTNITNSTLISDQKLSGLCVTEMRNIRQSLMEDYQITPEIVCHCGEEIDKFCKKPEGNGLDKAGATIHCLMQHANLHERQIEEMTKNKANIKELSFIEKQFRPECTRAVSVCLYIAKTLCIGKHRAFSQVKSSQV